MLKDYENWLWKMVGYRVCVCFMKEQGILHKNTLVTTVMSNLGLYKALDEEGIGYEQTTVGDRHIYENMSKNGYCLGGEESGHIIFKQYATQVTEILNVELKVLRNRGGRYEF